MHISRRTFLGGTAAAGMATGMQLAWSPQAAAAGSGHVLIYLFLRGGMDGLNLICPTTGDVRLQYETHRPQIQIPEPGATNGALPLANGWGINPAANKFKALWDSKDLAIIHGTGMPKGYNTRSHFDAQEFIERGITRNSTYNVFDGWLARYLEGLNIPAADLLPAISTDGRPVSSLAGFARATAVDSLNDFHWISEASMRDHFLTMMHGIYGATNDTLAESSQYANDMIDVVNAAAAEDASRPLTPHPDYQKDSRGNVIGLSSDLHDITKLLYSSLDFGLRAVTLNVGGWDTHRGQQLSYIGNFDGKIANLTQSVSAFVAETKALGLNDRYTIVIQSEFGRRVRENADRGTDHGTGNVMFVIGKNVRGGQFYGEAPSLKAGDLFDNEDVPVTTDYRHVIGEVLQDQFGVGPTAMSGILPGYSMPQRMGLFQQLVPTDEPPPGHIFRSSFE